jgi:hypothetical protein
MKQKSEANLMNSDEDMQKYLISGDGDRKDKFKNFCHHFGLDQFLPVQQLFNIPK